MRSKQTKAATRLLKEECAQWSWSRSQMYGGLDTWLRPAAHMWPSPKSDDWHRPEMTMEPAALMDRVIKRGSWCHNKNGGSCLCYWALQVYNFRSNLIPKNIFKINQFCLNVKCCDCSAVSHHKANFLVSMPNKYANEIGSRAGTLLSVPMKDKLGL